MSWNFDATNGSGNPITESRMSSAIVKKARALLRSPRKVLRIMWRRFCLRWGHVTFGPGLTFEGAVEIPNGRRVSLGSRVKLGKDIHLMAWPEGKLTVGDDTYIGRNTIVLAHQSVSIGKDCLIAPFCHITDVNHGIEAGELIRKQPLASEPVVIEDDVWLGAGCSVLPGVTIGAGAVIGARAVVTKDIPPNAIAVGVPARVIGTRPAEAAEVSDEAGG